VTLQINIGRKISKHASLAQQNGFGPALLHSLQRWEKAYQSLTAAVDWKTVRFAQVGCY
jgi:hypothetical protein